MGILDSARGSFQALKTAATKTSAGSKPKNIPTTRETPEPKRGSVGICLSGGGIRSASYNLGVLQVLEERGVLAEADYVAAVSGGAYIASAHAVAAREAQVASGEEPAEGQATGEPEPTAADTFRGKKARDSFKKHAVFGRGSPEEQYLRDHSTYLAPTPLARLNAVSIWVRGWLLNLMIVAFVLVVSGTLLGWLSWWLEPCLNPASARCPVPDTAGKVTNNWGLRAGLIVLLAGFLWFVIDALFDLSGRRDQRNRQWSGRLITLGVLVSLFFSIPYVLLWMRAHIENPSDLLIGLRAALRLNQQPGQTTATIDHRWVWVTQLVVVVNAVAAGVRLLTAHKRSIYVSIVAGLAGPVLLLLPFLAIVNRAASRGPTLHFPYLHASSITETWLAIGCVAVLVILLEVTFSCNRSTMHPFYAWRLSTAFALRRRSSSEAEPVPSGNPLKLSAYQPTGHPLYLYCAAANVMADGNAPPGRNAVPFVFAQDVCGGKLTKEAATTDLEKAMRTLTVPAAVAISGAAVSPTMGKFTNRLYTFLMTLLNIRLGVWVPNPRFLRETAEGAPRGAEGEKDSVDRGWRSRLSFAANGVLPSWVTPRPGLRYLLYEFIGWHRLDRRYLYVTDGGHYDNLGLVELFRRGCSLILCFDASGDRVDTFNTLGEAISMARTDLLVEVHIEPNELAPKKDGGLSDSNFVIGTFSYEGSAPSDEGVLVFAKTAVTEKAQWDIRAFHQKDPKFPNHSTIDQLFTDQKFESYRELGEQAARDALDGLEAFHAHEGAEEEAEPATEKPEFVDVRPLHEAAWVLKVQAVPSGGQAALEVHDAESDDPQETLPGG